jgi:hypothetical protein
VAVRVRVFTSVRARMKQVEKRVDVGPMREPDGDKKCGA